MGGVRVASLDHHIVSVLPFKTALCRFLLFCSVYSLFPCNIYHLLSHTVPNNPFIFRILCVLINTNKHLTPILQFCYQTMAPVSKARKAQANATKPSSQDIDAHKSSDMTGSDLDLYVDDRDVYSQINITSIHSNTLGWNGQRLCFELQLSRTQPKASISTTYDFDHRRPPRSPRTLGSKPRYQLPAGSGSISNTPTSNMPLSFPFERRLRLLQYCKRYI